MDDVIKAEECLLGSILLMPEVLDDMPDLEEKHFSLMIHQNIFGAIKTVRSRQPKPPGVREFVIGLVNHLRATDGYDAVGGAKKLADLTNAVPNAAHATYYFDIVRNQQV